MKHPYIRFIVVLLILIAMCFPAWPGNVFHIKFTNPVTGLQEEGKITENEDCTLSLSGSSFGHVFVEASYVSENIVEISVLTIMTFQAFVTKWIKPKGYVYSSL